MKTLSLDDSNLTKIEFKGTTMTGTPNAPVAELVLAEPR